MSQKKSSRRMSNYSYRSTRPFNWTAAPCPSVQARRGHPSFDKSLSSSAAISADMSSISLLLMDLFFQPTIYNYFTSSTDTAISCISPKIPSDLPPVAIAMLLPLFSTSFFFFSYSFHFCCVTSGPKTRWRKWAVGTVSSLVWVQLRYL